MAITYKKLFHMMIDRRMQNADLLEQAGFSANILTRLRRDQYVSLESIEKICLALGCKADDILEFIPEEKSARKQVPQGEMGKNTTEIEVDV